MQYVGGPDQQLYKSNAVHHGHGNAVVVMGGRRPSKILETNFTVASAEYFAQVV